MTREALHQYRVSLASVLLCLAALLQVQWLDFPHVHPMFVFLAAILLFPGKKSRDGKPDTSLIAIALIFGFKILSWWWHARTGQALENSPWFIGPLYLLFLFWMTHNAAKTMRMERNPDIEDARKSNSIMQ